MHQNTAPIISRTVAASGVIDRGAILELAMVKGEISEWRRNA